MGSTPAKVSKSINWSSPVIEPPRVGNARRQSGPYLRPLPEIGGWRRTFDLSREGTALINIRLFLRLGPSTLTETWLYLWTPPHT